MHAVGVGAPSPLAGPGHGWDVTPLLAAIAVVLIWRFALRREVTWAAVGVALVAGLVLATAADAWGPLLMWGVFTIIACVAVLRPPPHHPR